LEDGWASAVRVEEATETPEATIPLTAKVLRLISHLLPSNDMKSEERNVVEVSEKKREIEIDALRWERGREVLVRCDGTEGERAHMEEAIEVNWSWNWNLLVPLLFVELGVLCGEWFLSFVADSKPENRSHSPWYYFFFFPQNCTL